MIVKNEFQYDQDYERYEAEVESLIKLGHEYFNDKAKVVNQALALKEKTFPQLQTKITITRILILFIFEILFNFLTENLYMDTPGLSLFCSQAAGQ